MLVRISVSFSHLAIMVSETEIAGPMILVTKSFLVLCSLSSVPSKYYLTRGSEQRHSSSDLLSVIVGPYGFLAGCSLLQTMTGRYLESAVTCIVLGVIISRFKPDSLLTVTKAGS